MTIEGLGWTNLWLGILAILSLIEFLTIAAVGFFAHRMYRKTMTLIETIEQRHVLPLRAKVEAVIDEAQMVVGRVKDAEESVADARGQRRERDRRIGAVEGMADFGTRSGPPRGNSRNVERSLGPWRAAPLPR